MKTKINPAAMALLMAKRYDLSESVQEKRRLDEAMGFVVGQAAKKPGAVKATWNWLKSNIGKIFGVGSTAYVAHDIYSDPATSRYFDSDNRQLKSDKTLGDADSYDTFKSLAVPAAGVTGIALLANHIKQKQEEEERQAKTAADSANVANENINEDIEEGWLGALAGGYLGGGKDLIDMNRKANKIKGYVASLPGDQQAILNKAWAGETGDAQLDGLVAGFKDELKAKTGKHALGTAAGAFIGHQIEKATKKKKKKDESVNETENPDILTPDEIKQDILTNPDSVYDVTDIQKVINKQKSEPDPSQLKQAWNWMNDNPYATLAVMGGSGLLAKKLLDKRDKKKGDR